MILNSLLCYKSVILYHLSYEIYFNIEKLKKIIKYYHSIISPPTQTRTVKPITEHHILSVTSLPILHKGFPTELINTSCASSGIRTQDPQIAPSRGIEPLITTRRLRVEFRQFFLL